MATIELKGDLSVNDATRIRDVFLSAIQKKGPITLDVSMLEDFDVSILQLVYSLFKSFKEEFPLQVNGNISQTVKHRLYICGIIPNENIDDAHLIEKLTEKMRAAS